MSKARRAALVQALALLAIGLPAAAWGLVDVPTSERRAIAIADLASSSGVSLPVDTAVLPMDDVEYVRAYKALSSRGLTDPLGARLAAMEKARSDGALHLEFLRPQLDVRGFYLGSQGEQRVLYHSSDDELREGFNAFQSASGYAFWGDWLGGAYELQIQEDEGDFDYRTKRLYLKGVWGKWSLKVGRDSERLGPGYHSSLLLDDTAPTFDLWRVRTEQPLFLPGKLGWIGGFRFSVFNAYLADSHPTAPNALYGSGENVVEDPRLLGMRGSYLPKAWLEFGFNRAVMYGGKGRTTYDSPRDWWELLSARNEHTGGKYDNDQLASFDIIVSLPFLNGLGPFRGGKLYWEHGGGDGGPVTPELNWASNRAFWFLPFALYDPSYLGGLYVSTAITDFRFEYADVQHNWYIHTSYPQGYTYQGVPMGHHAGRDAVNYYFELSRHFGPAWRALLGVDLEERGRDQKDSERRIEGSLTVERYNLEILGHRVTVRGDALLASVQDPLDDPEQEDRVEYYLGAGIQLQL